MKSERERAQGRVEREGESLGGELVEREGERKETKKLCRLEGFKH